MIPIVSPYGSWKSPITAELVAGGEVGLEQIRIDGDDIYWIERRAQEGGRKVIVRRSADGRVTDVTPAGFNARTRVHEYGGGDYAVSDGTIVFSNFTDQRLYLQEIRFRTATFDTGRSAALRRRAIRLPQKSLLLRARGSFQSRRSRQHYRPHRSQRKRRGQNCGFGKRFLLLPAPESRRLATRMAHLESSQHALGRHGALGRQTEPRRHRDRKSKDRRRRRTNLFSSRSGRRTARSTLSPTAPVGGIFIGGEKTKSSRYVRWMPNSANLSGFLAPAFTDSHRRNKSSAATRKNGRDYLAALTQRPETLDPIELPFTAISQVQSRW